MGFSICITWCALGIIQRSHMHIIVEITKNFKQNSTLFREETRFFSQFSHQCHKSLKLWLYDIVPSRFQWPVLTLPVLAFPTIPHSHTDIKKYLPPHLVALKKGERRNWPAKARIIDLPLRPGKVDWIQGLGPSQAHDVLCYQPCDSGASETEVGCNDQTWDILISLISDL